MSGKRLAPALVGVLLTLALVPAGATVARPVLKCSWSGTMNSELSGSETEFIFSLGSGHGRCGLDGRGPYDIVSMQGQGIAQTEPPFTFDMDVHFRIRRISDGSLRSFDQTWTGVAEAVFVVFGAGKKGITGVGVVTSLYFPCCDAGPVSFTWVF